MNKLFNKKHQITLYLSLTLAFAVICAVLRSFMYFFAYDSNIGYFRESSALRILLFLFFGLSGILTVAFIIIINGRKPSFPIVGQSNSSKSAAIIAIGMTALMIINFSSSSDSGVATKLDLARLILFLASVFYFAPELLPPATYEKFRILRLFFGYALIFALTACIAEVYFDRYVPMNNPDKMMVIFAFLAFMLYFIFEFRFITGSPRPVGYLVASATAIFLGITFSISHTVSNLFSRVIIGQYSVYALAILLLTVYVIVKLIGAVNELTDDTLEGELCEEYIDEDASEYSTDSVTDSDTTLDSEEEKQNSEEENTEHEK